MDSLDEDLGVVPHRQTALVPPGVPGARRGDGQLGAGLGHLHHGSLGVVLDTRRVSISLSVSTTNLRHDFVTDTDQGVLLVLSAPDDIGVVGI